MDRTSGSLLPAPGQVGGSLLVIPVRNIKYIQVTPSPEKLPKEVLRGAWVAD